MSPIRFYRVVLLALAVTLTGSLATTAAHSDDSARPSGGVPTFAGDAGRTGVNPGPGPAAAPSEHWRFASTNTGFVMMNAPAVVDGVAYVSGFDAFLYALDAATGEERWRVNEGWWQMAIAVAGETLYLGVSFLGTDPHPAVFAFDATTGEERWRAGLAAGPNINVYAGPTVVGDTVYVAGTHGDTPYGLSALDAATGAERWHVQTTHGFPMADPVVVDGRVYLGGGPPDGETAGLIVLG